MAKLPSEANTTAPRNTERNVIGAPEMKSTPDGRRDAPYPPADFQDPAS
jgi:hypothetical protein